jgi:hypothetical protein
MTSSLSYLAEDPKPELEKDTLIWRRMLRVIPQMQWDLVKMERIQMMLWTIRSAGTELRPSRDGYRFTPLLDPDGFWLDQQHFDEIKKSMMAPYATEIRDLLWKLEGR